jgi:hypothetical protein
MEYNNLRRTVTTYQFACHFARNRGKPERHLHELSSAESADGRERDVSSWRRAPCAAGVAARVLTSSGPQVARSQGMRTPRPRCAPSTRAMRGSARGSWRRPPYKTHRHLISQCAHAQHTACYAQCTALLRSAYPLYTLSNRVLHSSATCSRSAGPGSWRGELPSPPPGALR